MGVWGRSLRASARAGHSLPQGDRMITRRIAPHGDTDDRFGRSLGLRALAGG